MNKLLYVLVVSVQFILGYSVYVRQYRDRTLRNGDLSDRIVFTTSREDDPELWFNTEHPQFEYTGQFWIGQERFVTGRIRQRNSYERFSRQDEDLNVKKLRQAKEVSWVIQEKAHIRVRKTNDPEWPYLWYFNGDISPSMKVAEAWGYGYSGNGIVVAVLDDGLQTDHPDLAANVDTMNDTDILDGDDDPNPPISSSHGTEVSGFIAAVKDNNICTVGVAYKSKIIGVRIIGDVAIQDSDEARALSHKLNYVDIYSNSWGPQDGFGFNKPGPLTEKALKEGITSGRKGKGAIYLWASGNGGVEDNCNADAYSNSIYTIAITAVEIGQNAWYSEVCACALAATYGGSQMDRYLTTTSTGSSCKNDSIQGTSYAAPIASGIVALSLEANPNLTWRDVQHLIVLTSSRSGFSDTYSNWTINGAHKEYSQILGFGLMNAEAMVNQSKLWVSVPEQQKCTLSTGTLSVSSTGYSNGIDVINVSNGDCPLVSFLEHVTANITFSFSAYRGETVLYLVSPKGTTSHLLHYRAADGNQSIAGSLTWTFMSVHFWRENPIGNWTLKFGSQNGATTVTLESWSLTFYGTSTDPLPQINQCSSMPCPGNDTCVNLVYKYICCPKGYTGEKCDTLLGTVTSQTTPSRQATTPQLTTYTTTTTSSPGNAASQTTTSTQAATPQLYISVFLLYSYLKTLTS